MMKKWQVRPLFGVLFVFIAASVCFWMVVSRDLFIVSDKKLLAFSAVDLADDSLRQDVLELLVGDIQTAKSICQRSYISAGRYYLDIGARSDTGAPMDLMSLEFHNLRLDFQRYLHDWWRGRRFEPDVMSNMVNVLHMRKCKTCAVVGNSGILLQRNLGEAIDSHEFVIRLNNARIGGYERFVGSKTSLSFMNSNILHLCSRRGGCFCHPYGESVPIMMYMSQPVHFLDYIVCNSSHKAPLMITDPQFDVLCARIVKYYSVKRFLKETWMPLDAWASAHGGVEFHYSSGMQAVMLALGVCDKVSIFGFGKSESAKHHYHTNQETELGLHHYQAEYDLYDDLVKSPEAIPFVSDEFRFPPVTIH